MKKRKTKAAFTIVELLVAMFLVVVLLAISSMVFRYAVAAQRAAAATAEIMQKYNAITGRLKADLQGLQKDGEIAIAWVPGIDTTGDNTVDDFTRLDRFYFFTLGNFHTYNVWPYDENGTLKQDILHGHVARVGYMLAGDGNGRRAADMPAAKRMLGRSQHLYTSKTVLNAANNPILFPNPTDYSAFTSVDNNRYEFDTITADDWRDDPIWSSSAASEKSDMVERILDVDVFPPAGGTDRGIRMNPANAENLHMLLAQGVGEFKVQGWFEAEKRWIPEVDPDGDGDFSDTDFVPNGTGIHVEQVPGIIYPYKFHALGPGYTAIHGNYDLTELDQAHFDQIPGLGSALKFTFTLYDSKGVFPDGKTFTYIVQLN